MTEFYVQYISAHFFRRLFFVISILFAEILSMYPFVLKPKRGLRISISLAVYLLFSLFFPECILGKFGSYVTALIFFVSIVLCRVCFHYSIRKILFNCVGAIALQNVVANIGQCMEVVFSLHEDWFFLFLELLLCIPVYLCSFLFTFRKGSNRYDISLKRTKVLLITALILFAVIVMMNFLRVEGLSNNLVCRLLMTLCTFCALLYQYSSSENDALISEREMMERIIKTEQEQYKISNDTIDLINLKYHDMKHLLETMDVKGADSREVMEELRQSMRTYDTVAQTGNISLDSILTAKSVYCEKMGIRFYYMADGKEIGFLSTTDIYSLFGNILDNAIQRELKEDPGNRYINLTVSRHGGMINIYAENYISSQPSFRDGIPITDQSDLRYHGFGTKSIRFICKKYEGNVEFFAKDKIFGVNALIPIPNLK